MYVHKKKNIGKTIYFIHNVLLPMDVICVHIVYMTTNIFHINVLLEKGWASQRRRKREVYM